MLQLKLSAEKEAEQLRQAEVRQAAERRKQEAIELEKRYQKESLAIHRAEVNEPKDTAASLLPSHHPLHLLFAAPFPPGPTQRQPVSSRADGGEAAADPLQQRDERGLEAPQRREEGPDG